VNNILLLHNRGGHLEKLAPVEVFAGSLILKTFCTEWCPKFGSSTCAEEKFHITLSPNDRSDEFELAAKETIIFQSSKVLKII
jgi:hypothetical protein